MPYVIKTDALPGLAPHQEVEVTERCYYGGKAVDKGDEAFIWFSGAVQRLAWSAEVTSGSRCVDKRTTVRFRLNALSGPDALTTAQLASFRDLNDGSIRSSLARKLYKHAHDKVASLNEEEASYLRRFFPHA